MALSDSSRIKYFNSINFHLRNLIEFYISDHTFISLSE